MPAKRALLLFVPLLLAAVLPGVARADGLSISIEKHARPTAGGGVVFLVHVTCGPLPGTEDFREGLAGAAQARTGAEAEGGLSPEVVCDGAERTYTAALSRFTDDPFRRGPADAAVAVIACNTVGDEQVCLQAGTQRRIIIAGPTLP